MAYIFVIFYGISFFCNEEWCSSTTLNLYTDASGSIGFGAVFCSSWCYGCWPPSWLYHNFAILEFCPIILSLYLWVIKSAITQFCFFTDNEVLVHVIKQSCCDKTLMVFVCKLVIVCPKNNILFKAKHIAGVKNKLADCSSRFQVQTFKQLAPAHGEPFPHRHTQIFAALKLASIITTHLTTSSLQLHQHSYTCDSSN